MKNSLWQFRKFILLVFINGLAINASAQKIVFIAPEENLNNTTINATLKEYVSKDFRILDDSLVETIYKNLADKNLFNLSTEESRNIGNAAGCNFFVIQKHRILRRASLSKPDYYESYLTIYLVSSRTGQLIFWKLLSAEAENEIESEKKLLAMIEPLATEISEKIESFNKHDFQETKLTDFPEIPAENSPEAKNFRPPLPYRRIKPAYTNLANIYNIVATVDAAVNLDETGKVVKIDILRWAGYGLDESVAETIKKMQWRPAEHEGKTLPIRILLRYNFKKLKNEEDEQ